MEILKALETTRNARENLQNMCFAAIHTSGFVNNPEDANRTIGNMELATIRYTDEQLAKMRNWPIWVQDEQDPDCLVGIEQHFDVVLEYHDGKRIRYCGTLDGLALERKRNNRITLDENKSANRIDDSWRAAFELSHQITGYCGVSHTVFGFQVLHARVTGCRVKPGGGEDVYPCIVSRKQPQILTWANWVRHTVSIFETYKDDYESAPLYPHSCNRYYRPCSLIPFCGDDVEGRRVQFYEEMVDADPTPSERAVINDPWG